MLQATILTKELWLPFYYNKLLFLIRLDFTVSIDLKMKFGENSVSAKVYYHSLT